MFLSMGLVWATRALAVLSRRRPEGGLSSGDQAKMQRRLSQVDESIARYLSQLDSADRQEVLMAGATA